MTANPTSLAPAPGRPSRRVARCHPDRPHCAWGWCKPCYDREYRAGQLGTTTLHRRTPRETYRPVIDLDLGHECQYGYYRWPVVVTEIWPDTTTEGTTDAA